ncbi:MAG: hypothetical protein GWO03_12065, partial [Gammaproteobacteria bacterium]|nr:hypothetical protein [Gammaproteobacteria bacterium]
VGSVGAAVVALGVWDLARARADRASAVRTFLWGLLLVGLVVCGAAAVYLPQFSLVDTVMAVVRAGRLPEETFGRLPGVAGEEAGAELRYD